MAKTISSALSKLPQASAWNLTLKPQRIEPRLWTACGPNVMGIFIIPIWAYSLVTTSVFLLILETKILPQRANQYPQPANRIPKQFFYLKRCLVSYMVMEDENTLSAYILDLFKILKCCICRDEVEGQLSLWDLFIYGSPKEIIRTKF